MSIYISKTLLLSLKRGFSNITKNNYIVILLNMYIPIRYTSIKYDN